MTLAAKIVSAVLAAGVLLSLAAAAPNDRPRPATPGGDVYEGRIVQWRLAADGTILFAVDASKPKPGTYWFRSPANKGSTTSVEELLLRVVLDGSAPSAGYVVTVRSESDDANSGKEPDEAIDFEWVGRS